MKASKIASKVLRIFLWILLGIVLVAIAAICMLYTPWAQNAIRNKVLSTLNSTPGTSVQIDGFRLKFPLRLDVAGVQIIQNADTMVAAQNAQADVRLLPLLRGEVDVTSAFLSHARYQMGNSDSVMMIVITADTIDLNPAKVKLKPLDIDIIDGYISHGRVALTSKVDTSTTAKPAPKANEMYIRVKNVRLHDFTYQMSMLPTIDSLGATVGDGCITDGLIDMIKQEITIKGFTGTRLNAAYIAPDSAQIAATPVAAPSTPGAPWTIAIDSIHFDNSHGLYTTHGIAPLPGLDFTYIEADSMDIAVNNFYDQGTTLRLPITLTGIERCGVRLDAKGTFAMDSAAMYFRDFSIATPYTLLSAKGMLGVGSMLDDPTLPLQLQANGRLGLPDLQLMFPAFKPYFAPLDQDSPLLLNVDVDGMAGNMNINALDATINHCVSVKGHGRIANAFSKQGPNGDVTLSGNIINVNSIVKSMASGSGLTIPPMSIRGHVALNGANIAGNMRAATKEGDISLEAKLNSNAEKYNIDVKTKQFPVNAFMKDLGIGQVTATLAAHGNGFDVFNKTTNLDAALDVPSLTYMGYDYKDIALTANIHDGQANVKASVDNPDVDATISANGNLDGNTYVWEASVDARRVDLQAIKMMNDPAILSLMIDANATATPSKGDIQAHAVLKNLDCTLDNIDYAVSDIRADFTTSDSLTTVNIVNRDFHANAQLPYCLDTIMSKFTESMAIMDQQISQRHIYVDTIQQAMPKFNMYIGAGNNNFINDILAQSRMSIQKLDLQADNDSVLSLRSQILHLYNGSVMLDTIGLDIEQNANKMHMIGRMDNRPGNLDEWAHIRLDGMLNSNRVAIRVAQRNNLNVTGYDIGAIATFADSTLNARLFPLTPVIGYKNWKVNFDNYVSYCFPTNKIEANLRMTGDKSSISLYTQEPTDSVSSQSLNDIVLKIDDIHIQDWISINPFAPPVTGNISADMHMKWDGYDINGRGTVSLDDFYYNREKVASIAANVDVMTNKTGMIRAQADLLVDGEKTMTLNGALNDSIESSPFNLDLQVIHFPLSIANPFLPADMARLNGSLNGSMDVSGDSKQPRLNGEISFDQAAVKLIMTNTAYRFSAVKIPVVDNLVSFKQFGISGTNENPLLINGTVDLSSFTNPKINLSLNAKNMMIVNSTSASKGATVFGKGYLDLDSKVKGDMNFLSIDADVTVLSGTNVTYLLTEAASKLQAPTQTDMVKFVNFNDTLQISQADTIANTMTMVIDASLNIQGGTTFVVDLGLNSRDKVQVQPQGSLNYTQAPLSEGRLTGRININNGYARYTLPVVGAEKLFTFDQGSYVSFNGDMFNPILNLHATDVVKANVTQSGQNSRLVNFDIMLGVTGTLAAMDVKFDLTTNDDLTVANELQSMSAEQRANQAMNLLLYNMYTGPGTKGDANLTANPLFSFLESQVNNWAAQNIKGVDVTFGIDQYNQTTNGSTSSTMSYSYQVSKTLFNDRFKIVIGGNYSTDDNPDQNLSQNLINDISFEYFLNKQQTMLVKLFRHTGYESILEGEVTQTGVGFVYRRKLNHLSQILPRYLRPKAHKTIL